MEDRRRVHWFLGMRKKREECKVSVDQERYIETTLGRFHLDQCKPSKTPADLNIKAQTAQEGEEEVIGSTEVRLDHFCIWSNRRGQTSCSQSAFCPDT